MGMYLITGGAGFIGRHLIRELHGAGHAVRVLDSLVEQVHGPGAAPDLPAEVECLVGDVRDRALVEKALRDADGVFHLAAEVGVGQSMYEVGRYVGANDLGTAVLMEAAVDAGVRRVVVASSMSIYGEGLYRASDGRLVEDAARRPADVQAGRWDPVGMDGGPLVPAPTPETKRPDLASVYALTKYAQERLVLMLAAAHGLEGVALRLFNVFGPGQALSNPYTGVLAIFASRLLNGQPPLVYEDGEQMRDFVHVADVARAFRLAMERPGIAGEVFNVASGRSRTVRGIATALAEAMDREDLAPQILGQARVGDIRHCIADIAKVENGLGFRPARQLEDSLLDLVEAISVQKAHDGVQEAHRELQRRGLVV
jgi:dTDP-L-rhamnose 4-epimerase